jgi:uncharacterized membrane protein
MEFFFGILVFIIYLSIFYFGYKKEYQRNSTEFIKTIIGMPVGFILSAFGFHVLNEKIKKWTKKNKTND